ncbi:MAG: glycerol kinase GlpK, partial [Verrucomicrobiaceae bacterium]
NVEGAREEAEAGNLIFGTIDSWLVWKLTDGAVHVTDATNASRTLLFNIHTGDWDDEILEILGIPRKMLPEVKGSSEVYGNSTKNVPIAGMAGDQHCALFGQACFEPGMAKNTYGTGCFMLMNTGSKAIPSKNNLLTTVAWKIGGKTEYALEGSIFVGGAVVQWLRDELKIVSSAEECSSLAASVPDAGGMYLVPAFAGLGAPHWDPYARGLCIGMTRGTNRAHYCRAALEGIAFQSADLIECMAKDSGIEIKELRVDGGASRSEPLMQFQSDLLGVNVVRPDNVETTAMGAAYLAGLAVGYWESKEDIVSRWKEDARFKPSREQGEINKLVAGWNRAVDRAKAWEQPDKES